MQSFKTHAAADISKLCEPRSFCSFEKTNCGHHRRPIGKSQAFFSSKRHGSESGSFESYAAAHHFPAKFRLALADQNARKMSERCEITRRTQASLLRNDWMNSAIQTFQYQLKRLKPNTRKPASQRVRPYQHDPPHSRHIKRITNPDSVTHNDIPL